MTRVQMLASSPRPLADVLVDSLRGSGNSLLRLRTLHPMRMSATSASIRCDSRMWKKAAIAIQPT